MAQRHIGLRRFKNWQPRLERLEERVQPAIFTVTTAADVDNPADDDVSLREAIRAANDNPNADGVPDTIAFNMFGGGVQIITPATILPEITEAVVIDGYTQPGSSPNTNPIDQPDNAVLLVELVGSLDTYQGLKLASNGSTVRGLAFNNFRIVAVSITGSDNRVVGNFVGTNAAGTSGPGNETGIAVRHDSNTIGGTGPADRNVISGGS